jgi:hypothetical protein
VWPDSGHVEEANNMDDRDRLAEFLSRYRIDGRPLSAEEARATADQMLELTNLSEAELAGRGYRWLTVVHGDLDTPEAEAAWRQLSRWGDRHPGAIRQTWSTNDTTAWLLGPPDAEDNLAALAALAQEHDPGWWKIRPGR